MFSYKFQINFSYMYFKIYPIVIPTFYPMAKLYIIF